MLVNVYTTALKCYILYDLENDSWNKKNDLNKLAASAQYPISDGGCTVRHQTGMEVMIVLPPFTSLHKASLIHSFISDSLGYKP